MYLTKMGIEMLNELDSLGHLLPELDVTVLGCRDGEVSARGKHHLCVGNAEILI